LNQNKINEDQLKKYEA